MGNNEINSFQKDMITEVRRIADSLEILTMLVQLFPADTLGNRMPGVIVRSVQEMGFDANLDPMDWLKERAKERNAKMLEVKLMQEGEK